MFDCLGQSWFWQRHIEILSFLLIIFFHLNKLLQLGENCPNKENFFFEIKLRVARNNKEYTGTNNHVL